MQETMLKEVPLQQGLPLIIVELTPYFEIGFYYLDKLGFDYFGQLELAKFFSSSSLSSYQAIP